MAQCRPPLPAPQQPAAHLHAAQFGWAAGLRHARTATFADQRGPVRQRKERTVLAQPALAVGVKVNQATQAARLDTLPRLLTIERNPTQAAPHRVGLSAETR